MPGPNPGARCSTCNHPQLAVIDDLLRAHKRRSYQDLADTFGLGQKAIERHHKRHVTRLDVPTRPQTTRTATPGPDESPASPIDIEAATADPADVLRRQLTYLDGLSLDDLSPAQRVDVMESRRRTADSLSKMEPAVTPDRVTVEQVEGLPELFTRMHERLKEFPGAREAMAEIWRDYRIEAAAKAEGVS